ncbi:MAG: hypothetical protein NTV34_12285 [Proteobacteria bacterium]|nr:hypothetical protein [Pseudomonadota bacterium]
MLQPAHAVAGSGSGSHGGDNKQLVQRSAWFPPLKQVSRTPIHYCYNLSPSFSVQDQIRITSAIETAYAEWHRYISDATKRQNEGNLLEIYQDMRLLVFDSACEEKTDLVFYLGQDSDPVTEESFFKDFE